MIFHRTNINGVYNIELSSTEDERGSFIRFFCHKEYAKNDIEFNPIQMNRSFNIYSNTLRGIHIQKEPHAEAKVIQCIRGSIFDVVVDLRENSPTYLKWEGFELNTATKSSLFIPAGLAHGFITTTPNTEIEYLMSEYYAPESATGIRWDDPKIGINWPCKPKIISDKDASWSLL